MPFETMADFAAGQPLSAEALNRIRANAEACLALECFGMPVFRVTYDAWDGMMYHWSRNLGWSIRAVGPTAGSEFTIDVEVPRGSGTWVNLHTRTGLADNTTYSGSVDLSTQGLTKGQPYRLRVRKTNTGIEVNRLFHYGSLPAAQGGYDWPTFGSLADGTLWTANDWNALPNALRYLYDQLSGPRAPTRAELDMAADSNAIGPSDAARTPSATPWRGYVQHRLADHLAYQIGGWAAGPADTDGGRANLSILRVDPSTAPPTYGAWAGMGVYYNAFFTTNAWGDDPPKSGNDNLSGTFWIDGYLANPPHKVQPYLARISTSTDNSGPPGAANLTGIPRGEWLEVRLNRHDGGQSYRLILQAAFTVRGEPNKTGWVDIAPFAHGEYADGTAAKLADLVANLNELKTRIESFPHLPCQFGTDLYFYRRGNLLKWAGSNVVIHWTKGRWPARGQSEQTRALGTTADVGTIDLRELDGSVPGGFYYLTGQGEMWAAELMGDEA